MKALLLFLCSVPFMSPVAYSAFVAVPGAGQVQAGEGDPYLLTRNILPNERWQQIFNGNAFSAVGTDPFSIVELAYAPVQGSIPIDVNLANIEIRMSTTPFSASHQNASFAANIGPNETVVYSGGVHFYDSGIGRFSIRVALQHPFLYSPQAGNLLVDIWNFAPIGPPASGSYGLEYALFTGDAVSSLTGDVNSSTGFLTEAGLITQFTVNSIPEPGVPAFGLAVACILSLVHFRRSPAEERR
jgi:hypothetical protein